MHVQGIQKYLHSHSSEPIRVSKVWDVLFGTLLLRKIKVSSEKIDQNSENLGMFFLGRGFGGDFS